MSACDTLNLILSSLSAFNIMNYKIEKSPTSLPPGATIKMKLSGDGARLSKDSSITFFTFTPRFIATYSIWRR